MRNQRRYEAASWYLGWKAIRGRPVSSILENHRGSGLCPRLFDCITGHSGSVNRTPDERKLRDNEMANSEDGRVIPRGYVEQRDGTEEPWSRGEPPSASSQHNYLQTLLDAVAPPDRRRANKVRKYPVYSHHVEEDRDRRKTGCRHIVRRSLEHRGCGAQRQD